MSTIGRAFLVALVLASTVWGVIGQERVNRGLDDGDGWPWIVSEHRIVQVIATASFAVVGILVVAVIVTKEAGRAGAAAR